MRKAASSLSKLAEEYLMFRSYKESGTIGELLYLRKLREKRLGKLFIHHSEKLDLKLLKIDNSIDSQYFRNKYLFELEKINYYVNFNQYISKQQLAMQNIQRFIVFDSLINLLDIGFNILVGISTMYNSQKNLVLQMLDNIELDSVRELIKNNEPELFPIFEIFHKRYLGFKNIDDDNYYFIYKKIALENLMYLTWENQFTIFISLQNICIRKFIEGKRNFANELHLVHKEMLKKGLYVQEKDDYMNLHTYRNIVLTASNLGKNDWIMRFMNKYINKTLPEQRDSLTAWTKALVYYNSGKFINALKELQAVKNDHFLTKHEIKTLTMKIFYELNEIESAISLVQSYKKMIKNDKTFSQIHRKSYSNFSDFFLKLIKLKADCKFEEAEYLKIKIEKSVSNSKEWLLTKINDLINKKNHEL
jgi:hypothetical protein